MISVVEEEQQEDEEHEETNQNKIASIVSKPNCQRTKEENETVVLHIIDKMIQEGNNKDLINKIAAVTSQHKKKGEVAEFQSLIHSIR